MYFIYKNVNYEIKEVRYMRKVTSLYEADAIIGIYNNISNDIANEKDDVRRDELIFIKNQYEARYAAANKFLEAWEKRSK